MTTRSTDRSTREGGIALVVVMLILLGLALAGVGLLTTANGTMRAVSRDVAGRRAIAGADGATVGAVSWLEGQGALAPLDRVNLAGITDPAAPGYWNVRNVGGIGDSSSSIVSDWSSAPTDDVLTGPPEDVIPVQPPALPVPVWFEIENRPALTVYGGQYPGQEAGKVVEYTYTVRSIASPPGGGALRVERDVRQPYLVSFYGD